MDSGRQEDYHFIKRNEKFADEAKLNGILESFLDQPYEKLLSAEYGGISPDEFVKTNQYLWQIFNEQLSKFYVL